MISTEELMGWKDSILHSKEQAERNALDKSNNPEISKYYMHVATVCGYQANIVERIIAQSERNEKRKRGK